MEHIEHKVAPESTEKQWVPQAKSTHTTVELKCTCLAPLAELSDVANAVAMQEESELQSSTEKSRQCPEWYEEVNTQDTCLLVSTV